MFLFVDATLNLHFLQEMDLIPILTQSLNVNVLNYFLIPSVQFFWLHLETVLCLLLLYLPIIVRFVQQLILIEHLMFYWPIPTWQLPWQVVLSFINSLQILMRSVLVSPLGWPMYYYWYYHDVHLLNLLLLIPINFFTLLFETTLFFG